MSITINIEDLLQQRIVESSRIEYKKDWNPSTIIHSICAFANDIREFDTSKRKKCLSALVNIAASLSNFSF